ncbi:MAG: precorrin-2 C(20)-methyltransferase [Pseudomonadota bacterium]|jgi:precorrin-2/cobalt-factor-2 C20-methyltransferase
MNSQRKGRLIGASLGPGDPGLITRRAWEVLQGPAHWAYPVRRKGGDSYALDIVRRAGLGLPAAHTPLTFPMTHDAAVLARYWLQAAQTVHEILLSGRDVVFLVEGDTSTYSTFTYLSRSVRALDEAIEVETIAGVPSYHACAAHLGEPLAEGDETFAILPAGYGVDTVERLLSEFDTLVLLKVKPLLDDLIDLLKRRGLLAHGCFLEKVGTPEERIVRDLARLKGEKVNYLSLLLVKNPGRTRGTLQRGCRKKARVEGEPE